VVWHPAYGTHWRFSSTAGASDTATNKRNSAMIQHSVLIQPIVALLAGILILVRPQTLNLVVAIYLILIGLAGLVPLFMK
jgi:hypothetical protein